MMNNIDYNQSIIAGGLNLFLTPLFEGNVGAGYFDKLIDTNNIINSIGFAASDAAAQAVVNSVSVPLSVRGSNNGVDNVIQAASTGLIYETVGYGYDVIVDGSKRSFFKKSTLKSIIKMGLVDSAAQIATPNLPAIITVNKAPENIKSLSGGGDTPAIKKQKMAKTKVVNQPAHHHKKNSSKIVA